MNDSIQITELKAKVLELQLRVQELSLDAVTGIWGRSVLDVALGTEFARAKRYQRRLGVLMIDIDHFKRVNDDHGHLIGDDVLRAVAQAIQHYVRDSDILIRYGGEEFVVLVDGASPESLMALSERIRGGIEQLERIGNPFVTVSVGCAMSQPSDGEKDLLERADAALYAAKNNGRNQVHMKEPK